MMTMCKILPVSWMFRWAWQRMESIHSAIWECRVRRWCWQRWCSSAVRSAGKLGGLLYLAEILVAVSGCYITAVAPHTVFHTDEMSATRL